MGIDLERKFCRADRRYQKRGNRKKREQHRPSKSRTSNKQSRMQSLKKRHLQDVKSERCHFSSDWEFDRCSFQSSNWEMMRMRRSHNKDRMFSKAFSVFTDSNFKCETPMPWDIGCSVRDPVAEHLAEKEKYPGLDYIPPLVRNIYDITQFYSIPDFNIQGYPEDETCFDRYVLMKISEYVPEFGFWCFQQSKETMYDGSVSHDCTSPSIFHFIGNMKRDRTFNYKFERSGYVNYSDSLPELEKRHFRLERKSIIHITNATMLFRFDIGTDDSEKILQCDARDWYSVTAFLTAANLVLLIFSSGKQEFARFGENEYWCANDSRSSSLHFCECWGIGSTQEVYGYDLDIFLKLFQQAGNLYDMRFHKYCLFIRGQYNIKFYD